jgi:hypothetical protein
MRISIYTHYISVNEDPCMKGCSSNCSLSLFTDCSPMMFTKHITIRYPSLNDLQRRTTINHYHLRYKGNPLLYCNLVLPYRFLQYHGTTLAKSKDNSLILVHIILCGRRIRLYFNKGAHSTSIMDYCTNVLSLTITNNIGRLSSGIIFT